MHTIFNLSMWDNSSQHLIIMLSILVTNKSREKFIRFFLVFLCLQICLFRCFLTPVYAHRFNRISIIYDIPSFRRATIFYWIIFFILVLIPFSLWWTSSNFIWFLLFQMEICYILILLEIKLNSDNWKLVDYILDLFESFFF